MRRSTHSVKAPRRRFEMPRDAARYRGPLRLTAISLALFLAGYLIAVFLLFPPPDAPKDGIEVPDLTGLSLSGAADRLRPMRLEVGDTLSVPHQTLGPGIIVAQSPLAGQQLRPGDRVRIGISSGLAAVAVPELSGMGARRAENLLSRLGFDVDKSFEVSYEPNGTVIRSVPEAGTRHPLPARILLLVSSGPPLDTMRVDTTVNRDTIR